MTSEVNPHRPVQCDESLLREMYTAVRSLVEFEALRGHVESKLGELAVRLSVSPAQADDAKSPEGRMPSPDFYSAALHPTLPTGTFSQRSHRERLRPMVDAFEVSLMLSLHAQHVEGPPLTVLQNLSAAAVQLLNTEIEAYRAYQRRSRRCSHGAKMGHRDFNRLRCVAVRLIRTKAPADGWLSKAHAGDVVADALVLIATGAGYKGSLEPDRWSQTVQRLIRHDKRAKATYEAHRAERRGKRSSVR